MAGPGRHREMGALSALALVGQVGFSVAIPIVAGVLAGVYLENRFDSRGIVLIAMIGLGIAAGVAGAYYTIRKHLD